MYIEKCPEIDYSDSNEWYTWWGCIDLVKGSVNLYDDLFVQKKWTAKIQYLWDGSYTGTIIDLP